MQNFVKYASSWSKFFRTLTEVLKHTQPKGYAIMMCLTVSVTKNMPDPPTVRFGARLFKYSMMISKFEEVGPSDKLILQNVFKFWFQKKDYKPKKSEKLEESHKEKRKRKREWIKRVSGNFFVFFLVGKNRQFFGSVFREYASQKSRNPTNLFTGIHGMVSWMFPIQIHRLLTVLVKVIHKKHFKKNDDFSPP